MLLTLLAAAAIAIPSNAVQITRPPSAPVSGALGCPNTKPMLTPAASTRASGAAKAHDNRPDVVILGPSLQGPTVPMFAVPHTLLGEPQAYICEATPIGPPSQYK